MVANESLADELNTLLATETRSLCRHLHEAKPYLTAKTYRAWRQIEQGCGAASSHVERLLAICDRLRVKPRPIAFPPGVADLHFIALTSLLPKLAEEKRAQVEAYARAVTESQALGDAAVTRELTAMREDNRQQLAVLEELLKSQAG
jgi:hypothetical protein